MQPVEGALGLGGAGALAPGDGRVIPLEAADCSCVELTINHQSCGLEIRVKGTTAFAIFQEDVPRLVLGQSEVLHINVGADGAEGCCAAGEQVAAVEWQEDFDVVLTVPLRVFALEAALLFPVRICTPQQLLVPPVWQEADTAIQCKEGLSGAHIQSLAIPAQQKGCVVGDVFSFKSEKWPLFRALAEGCKHGVLVLTLSTTSQSFMEDLWLFSRM